MEQENTGEENALESQGNDTPNESNDSVDYAAELAKAKELAENYKIRAEKAEKAKRAEPAPAERKAQTKQSDGLDYGQKAFLATNDIKGAQEYEFVDQEMKASGQDLDSLLENDYFKSKLADFRSLNKSAEATPSGNRSGSPAMDNVEYWMGKDIKDVPAEMRIQVVNAKLAKSKKTGVFYNS